MKKRTEVVKKTPKVLSVLLVGVATACGGGIVAPEACQPYPEIVLHVGESETLRPCFTAEATVSGVESANPEIADAVIARSEVTISAHRPGETTITITGSNGDATGEIVIPIFVPNRAPEIVEAPGSNLRLPVGRTTGIDLTPVFRDPDGQELTYSAESSAPSVARVTVSEALLTIEALEDGVAEILVAASDGEESATAALTVTVIPYTTIYEDDFNGGVGQWQTQGENTRLRTANGNLEVWVTDDSQLAGISLLSISASTFDIRARLRPGRDSTAVVLGAILAHDVYTQIEINIQTFDEDYGIWAFNSVQRRLERWASGDFGLGSSDDYTEVRFWYENDQYHVQFNDGDPVSVGDASSTTESISTIAFISEHYFSGDVGEERRVYMDRISVSGTVSAGAWVQQASEWIRRRQ